MCTFLSDQEPVEEITYPEFIVTQTDLQRLADAYVRELADITYWNSHYASNSLMDRRQYCGRRLEYIERTLGKSFRKELARATLLAERDIATNRLSEIEEELKNGQ